MTDVFDSIVTPTVRIVSVTPEMAERWLGKNTKNRNVRQAIVNRYAADMKAGRWTFTGEAVKFSVGGRLLDGQHRLQAVIASNVTVSMLVITDLDDSSQDVMDTGAKRTGADMLSMHEIKNAPTVAAVARIIAVGLDSTEPVSHGEILEIVERDQLVIYSCEYISTLSLRRVPPAALAYSFYRLAKVDADAADQFFRAWSSLANLPEGSPILALARRIGAHEGRQRGLAIRKEIVACVFLAWNAWRRGETRSIIKIPRKVDGSVSFPEPV